MNKYMFLLFMLMSCKVREASNSELADAGVPSGQFRGVAVVEQMLKQTVFESDGFQLTSYLPGLPNTRGSLTDDQLNIAAQMGGFSGEGRGMKYDNGKPNALNTVLWVKTFKNLISSGIFSGPFGDSGLDMKDDAKNAVAFCLDPQKAEQVRGCLSSLWDAFLFASPPPRTQKDEWIKFFADESGLKGKELVSEALLAGFMNPYFILKN